MSEEEVVVDARGSFCPGPLMETIKTIRKVPSGTKIIVLSSDEGSTKDIPKWAEKAGHKVENIVKEENYWKIIIVKK